MMEKKITEFISYRIESAAAKLVERIAVRKRDPFEKELIICSGKTMEQYLIKTAVDLKKTAPLFNFLFPRNAVNHILSKVPETETVTRLDKNIMGWEIYKLMPELERDPRYLPFQKYLSSTSEANKEFRRYKLAFVVAGIFDSYLMYRGDWLEHWQDGNDSVDPQTLSLYDNIDIHLKWQADLWRKLTKERKPAINYSRHSELLKKHLTSIKKELPKRISVFGLSSLPPDLLQFLRILSSVVHLDFYHITPCIEFFADCSKSRAEREFRNYLLASWGTQGKDFQNLLLENDMLQGVDLDPAPHSYDDSSLTLLQAIQHDIIMDRGFSSAEEIDLDFNVLNSQTTLFSREQVIKDSSFTVISTYSKFREVQVLKNHITALLHDDKMNVNIDDIAVMTPDIESYAPYIKAVFGTAFNHDLNFENKDFIPFSIADCSTTFDSPEAEAFLKIMTLPDGRMTSEDVFEIISSAPLMSKLQLSHEDLEQIRIFLEESHIAWGMNKEHRSKIIGTEYSGNNTWKFGFDRMLAGYAFGDDNLTEDGVLPLFFQHSNGLIAGKLIKTVHLLYDFMTLTEKKLTPNVWFSVLSDILTNLFEVKDTLNEETVSIHEALNAFRTDCVKAEINSPMPIQIVRDSLTNFLANSSSASKSFFRGSLTFCRLLPMRNIPFKAICILGMNDGEYPRISGSCGFDLTDLIPRKGDRSVSNEDRFIFLEILLACRQHLYLSFVGKNKKDNEKLSPSIILDELLDYISNATQIKKHELITEHPLHSFDRRYFIQRKDAFKSKYKRLFSYSQQDCNSMEKVRNFLQVKNLPNCSNEKRGTIQLPIPDERDLIFSFDDFVSFFLCPSAFFLNWRLNILSTERETLPLPVTEPLVGNKLIDYNIAKLLIEKSDPNIVEKIKAEGILPYNNWGEEIISNSLAIASNLREKINNYGEKITFKKQFSFKVRIPETKHTLIFQGLFKNLYDAQIQLFHRPASVKFKDLLNAYLFHCLASAMKINSSKTLVIAPDEDYCFSATKYEDALSYLTQGAIIFYQGLMKPLPLFLHSSSKYAEEFLKTQTKTKALAAAGKHWDNATANIYAYDLKDKANHICFGSKFPPLSEQGKLTKLTHEFVEFAELIYMPVIKNAEKLEN